MFVFVNPFKISIQGPEQFNNYSIEEKTLKFAYQCNPRRVIPRCVQYRLYIKTLKGNATLKSSESEMQALIKPCNLSQTRSKPNETKGPLVTGSLTGE